jgi:hypothetical protein
MLIRVLAAGVAGGIVFFALGFLLFGVLLDPYFRANMVEYPGLMKTPMPEMLPLIAWNLVNGIFFAFIFDRWASIRTFVGGLKGGAMLMFMLMLMTDLQYVAFMNIWKGGPVPILVDVLAGTVLGTVAGGAVGFVLGLMHKRAAE